MKVNLRLLNYYNKLLLLALVLFYAFSCKEENDVYTDPVQEEYSVSQNRAITAAENLDIASSSKSSNRRTDGVAKQGTGTKQVKSINAVKDHKKTDAYFIINYKDGGFAIISADERVLPVLAYSETGSFITDSIPSGLNE